MTDLANTDKMAVVNVLMAVFRMSNLLTPRGPTVVETRPSGAPSERKVPGKVPAHSIKQNHPQWECA